MYLKRHVLYYRVTWWQLGLLTRIFVFHCANCWFECWQGRSLSDSQQSFYSDVVFMREQVCSSERSIADQREVQQVMVA